MRNAFDRAFRSRPSCPLCGPNLQQWFKVAWRFACHFPQAKVEAKIGEGGGRMMNHKFAAFTLAAVLCAAGVSTSHGQQQPQQSAEAPYSGGPVATKSAGIFDPTFGGLLFTSFTIPADWVFQGGMTHGTGCNVTSAPFFRATSPDGLTGAKLFPPTDFAWAGKPAYMPGPNSGCIARVGEIKA